MAAYIIVGIVAYLIGSISFSVIISKKMAGFDVREKGSGNAGATNMLRSVGKKAAILTLLGDALKGVVAILFAIIVGAIAKSADKSLLVQIAGILVVVGHTFPIFFGFKGGKGIAATSGLVISLILFPKYCFMFTIFGMVTFGLVTKFSRYVSLGSITGIIGFFIEFVIWGLVGWLPLNNNEFIEASIVVLLFVILGVARHSGNIKRLINGTERKIGEKK